MTNKEFEEKLVELLKEEDTSPPLTTKEEIEEWLNGVFSRTRENN